MALRPCHHYNNINNNNKRLALKGEGGEEAAVCLSCIRSIKSVNMSSSDNEYAIRELRKEIDYLAEDVEKLKRLVKNMKDVNSLKLTADDKEYLRGID